MTSRFSLRLDPQVPGLFSFDHLIRSLEHAVRNGETNLFCCFKIDDEFKLRRLLYGQISRFGTFQDLVDVNSRAPVQVSGGSPVEHEPSLINKFLLRVNRRDPMLASKLNDAFS